MKAIITIGIAASGKTTWTEQFIQENPDWININRDDVRFETFCNGERDWSKYKLTGKKENIVTKICTERLSLAAQENKNVVISDTNLNPVYRDSLIQRLEFLGYTVEIKEFPISLEEAWSRDALRCNGVGRDVIYRQYKQWLNYSKRKRYIPNGIDEPAVIVDIDGTVAIMDGRSPYDWASIGTDLPNHHVIDIVNRLSKEYKIVFLSGRDGSCEEQTRIWLQKYFIGIDFELFMRSPGSNRKDFIIKEELFWNKVVPFYSVSMVIDDRPSVCRMWRELGLNVIQVGDPYNEF